MQVQHDNHTVGSASGEGRGTRVLCRRCSPPRRWRGLGRETADRPDPLHALLAAFGRLALSHPVRTVFVPVRVAYPAIGFADGDVLPKLRSNATDKRSPAGGRTGPWPAASLHLIAESARMGAARTRPARDRSRKKQGLLAGGDRRSRLSDAFTAVLRAPLLTPNALATQPKVAWQNATSLLGTLQANARVREVTGRGRFRAFAL
jgi:hypothetical protein